MRLLATPTATHGRPGLAALQWCCGYGMIVAVAPYAVLKVCWLLGYPVGIPDTSPAMDFVIPNLVTLALDLAAVATALALAADRARRWPAWLLLVPGWTGMGLLAPTVLIVTAGFAHGLLTEGQPVVMRDGLVEPWTYTLVYSSFAIQGTLLSIGLALHARRRWPDLLTETRTSVLVPGARVVAIGGALAAGAVGAARLFEAIAAPADWRASDWTFASRFSEATEGAFALAAGVGVLALAGLLPRLRHAVALTWLGSATLFAWGLMRTFSLAARAPMSDLITRQTAIIDLTATLAGLLIALTALFLLTAQRLPRTTPPATTSPD
ncbi:hypothetical protein Kfla_6210 [Kribbella flavida DSM 17836]|uniref:Uncharacterized protein n=1 Tax=Kribbella flavida (strain DSM 17836 / JCM 10339 / NBRC 14399) TaxID=479435 RepID=D2PVH3_KRIFD|nr:hypothetical protein [Kribbella flavida]ADB35213.1 hypothetical protein Kfla_6210 [Kribbella flavida DSM 17836]